MVSIVLDRPISSAEICGVGASNKEAELAAAEQAKLMVAAEMQKIEAEKNRLSQLISSIESAAIKIEEIRRAAVSENQRQIALFAVEIARKILMSEIEEGKYDIVAMIEKALQASPSRDGATVRLSPADFTTIEEVRKTNKMDYKNIRFESDGSILPAQCFVMTSKGVVEYFVEDQLERIGVALGAVENPNKQE